MQYACIVQNTNFCEAMYQTTVHRTAQYCIYLTIHKTNIKQGMGKHVGPSCGTDRHAIDVICAFFHVIVIFFFLQTCQ